MPDWNTHLNSGDPDGAETGRLACPPGQPHCPPAPLQGTTRHGGLLSAPQTPSRTQRAASKEEKKIFLKKYIRNPSHIGSIAPSSKYLSQEIARLVEGLEKTKVIELGPGTGALTAHLRASEPTIVEIDRDLCEILQKKFPNLKVINSCALDFLRGIDYPCGIIFSIPMINNPLKDQLASEVQRLHRENLLKWCVMYTYGLGNPFKGIAFSSATRHKTILRNLPPAHIWHYN